MTPNAPNRMRVWKYIPNKLYGFVSGSDETQQAFFHLGSFDPGQGWGSHPRCEACSLSSCTWAASPPPILGEPVDVVFGPEVEVEEEGKAPRAQRVIRVNPPIPQQGTVESFDPQRGYGFVMGLDGISYHLHRSELLEGRLPHSGQQLMFFAGERQNRPRACHCKVCPHDQK